MDYKFKLLKIHCAGCALALEQNLNQIESVQVEINFVTKILKLHIDSDEPEQILSKVKDTIHLFDHSIEILDYEDEEDIARREKQEREFNIFKLTLAFIVLILNYFVSITWLKVIIYLADYILVSYKILISAGRNILNGKIFDENFLMSIASIGAFIIGEYVEAVAVMFLYGVGAILEDLAVQKSRRTISALLEIKQPYANLFDGENEIKVSLDKLSIGDLIRIKPGERVPLDSVIVEGTSYLDMSALTGESLEKIVTVGDKILSGSINGASVLLAKVEKLEADSTVSKIVDLVEKATEAKAKSEKTISKFSSIYTPVVIVLAFLIMIVPPSFSAFRNFSEYAYRALCFLVVSCPCALVISVPLTYFASIGSFARNGIVVKGATFVEELAKVDTVIFDKTGTITEGNFEITEIYAYGEHTKEEVLETIAYAESFSNHRIAKSVLEKYSDKTKKQINSAWVSDYSEIAGKGIKANIFMQSTIVGNAKFLKENGVHFFEVNKNGTVLYLAVEGEFIGYIVIEDTIKKDSANAVGKLKKLGIKDISICSGDEENAVKAIGKKLGIQNCYFGLLPEDKVLVVTDKVQSGQKVAFVGDGINDAPPLANSNVGISMGKLGTDIAVEASDVVIMTDEPSKVAYAIKKAKKTHRIVLQNIIGSIGIKALILILIGFGFSGMWLAVFADVGVNLLAVLNSLRAMLK